MAFLSIIRRWALREHLSIREIARRTKLSRNTIRKYLRSGAVEPEFRISERPSKLDPYAAKLSGWLKTEAGKSRKQRRTAKQLHEDSGEAGLHRVLWASGGLCPGLARGSAARTTDDGSRNLSCRWSFNLARRSSSTGARILRCWAASGPSCRWRISSCRTAGRFWSAPIHAADPRDAVRRACGTGSGSSVVCRGAASTITCAQRLIVSVGRGKERQVNARFLAMTSHYVFEPEFCNPAWLGRAIGDWSKGEGGRSRRTFRIPATGFGSPCRTSPIWPR